MCLLALGPPTWRDHLCTEGTTPALGVGAFISMSRAPALLPPWTLSETALGVLLWWERLWFFRPVISGLSRLPCILSPMAGGVGARLCPLEEEAGSVAPLPSASMWSVPGAQLQVGLPVFVQLCQGADLRGCKSKTTLFRLASISQKASILISICLSISDSFLDLRIDSGPGSSRRKTEPHGE